MGAAYILVQPSFKGFQQQAKAEMRSQMPPVGEAAGETYSRSLGKAAEKGSKEAGQSATRGLAQALRSSSNPVISAGRSIATRVVDGLNGEFTKGRTAGRNFVTRIGEGIDYARTAIYVKSDDFAKGVVRRASEGLKAGKQAISTAWSNTVGTALMAFGRTQIGTMVGQGRQWVTNAANGIRTGIGAVTGAVSQVFSGVVAPVVTRALTTGRNFISSAVGALRTGVGQVTGAITGVFSGAGAAGRAGGAAAGSGFASSLMAMLGPIAAMFSAGAILGGGFNRLANIDDARKRMEGLKYTGEQIDSVMQSANEAVTDTAFGLDVAAAAAAGALGSGVQLGDDLTSYIKTIGDMTMQSTTDFSSMSTIMNKIQGSGKLTGETLAQLEDNGVSAAYMLAKGFGVSQEAVRKMASEGKISAEDFRRIMDEQVGGSALRSGETVRGALDNVRAALSRTGAALMGGEAGFSVLPGILDKVKDAINGINDEINNAWEWIRENKDWLGPVVKGALGAIGVFKGLQIATGLVNGAFRLLAANPLLLFLGLIGAAVGYLWTQNEDFRNIVTAVWEKVSGAIKDAWEGWIKPALERFWTFITEELGPILTSFWEDTVKPAWESISATIKDAWEKTIEPTLSRLWAFIKDTLMPVVMGFWEDVVKPAWSLISEAIKLAWEKVIQPAMSALWGFINDKLAPVIFWLWDNVVGPVFTWIGDAITGFWEIVRPVLDAFRLFLQGDIAGALDSLKQAVGRTFEWIGNTIGNVLRIPVNFVIETIWNKGIVSVVNAVSNALGLGWTLKEGTPIPPFGGVAVAAYAEGGYAPRGWALVGEEGPELIDLRTPGRVYTAPETAAAIALSRDLTEDESKKAAGSSPHHATVPMGDWGAKAASAMSWLGDRFDDAWGWVRGRLADGAGLILSPLRNLILERVASYGTIGSIIGGTGQKMIDGVLDWIRGKDDEYNTAAISGEALPGTAPTGLARPSSGRVTSWFGPRWGGFHAGIDFAGGHRTYSPADGVVVGSGWNIGPGRTGVGLLIAHPGAMWSYFGHNPVGGVQVRKGQRVAKRQHVGYEGTTGNVTGKHVHFEIHRGRPWAAVNPKPYLFDDGGYLYPGQLATNHTRRPEAVLTSSQWDAIAALAGRGASLDGAHITGTLQIGEDGLARLVEGRIVAADKRKMQRVRAGFAGAI